MHCPQLSFINTEKCAANILLYNVIGHGIVFEAHIFPTRFLIADISREQSTKSLVRVTSFSDVLKGVEKFLELSVIGDCSALSQPAKIMCFKTNK